MAQIRYPKVLIVSVYDFHEGNNATSITLRNLFNNWPDNKICHIHCETYEIIENSPIHLNRRNLNIADIKWNKILHYFKKKKDKVLDDSLLNNDVVVIKSAGFISIIKQKIRIFFSASADLLPYRISPKLSEFILAQNPDVVYVIPSSKRIIRLAIALNRKFSLPIVPHFMDDWPSTIYKDSAFCLLQRKLTLIDLYTLLKKSKNALVISEAMEKEYEQRYSGVQFHTLMNTLPEYLGEAIPKSKTNKKTTFCYAGGLHLNRWSSLLSICSSLHKFSDIELTIYTKPTDWNYVKERYAKYPFVKYGGFFKSNEMLDILNKYDYLIFVESFDEGIKKYTRLSISTKIPEYLCLGKPIIAIGPSDIASINYLKQNDAALILDEQNTDKWDLLIENALNDKYFFVNKINHCKEIFNKNHLQIKQQVLLANILSKF